jgi:hypothetical protein
VLKQNEFLDKEKKYLLGYLWRSVVMQDSFLYIKTLEK